MFSPVEGQQDGIQLSDLNPVGNLWNMIRLLGAENSFPSRFPSTAEIG